MPPDVNYLLRVEYLALNLAQKLHAMEPHYDDFMAEASAFGVAYKGPNFQEELSDLTETLKENN